MPGHAHVKSKAKGWQVSQPPIILYHLRANGPRANSLATIIQLTPLGNCNSAKAIMLQLLCTTFQENRLCSCCKERSSPLGKFSLPHVRVSSLRSAWFKYPPWEWNVLCIVIGLAPVARYTFGDPAHLIEPTQILPYHAATERYGGNVCQNRLSGW
jgi:hypothetical protein